MSPPVNAFQRRNTAPEGGKSLWDDLVDHVLVQVANRRTLGAQIYGESVVQDAPDKFGNVYYKRPNDADGAEGKAFRGIFTAEIGSYDDGTWLENWGPKPLPSFKQPWSDQACKSHRQTLSVAIPPDAPGVLREQFINGQAFLDDISADFAAIYGDKGFEFIEVLHRSDGNKKKQPDCVLLRLQPLYSVPVTTRSAAAEPTPVTPRKRISRVGGAATASTSVSEPPALAEDVIVFEDPLKPVSERAVGDKFPLTSLPGWELGNYFGQREAYIEIRDYRDENGDLIAPFEYRQKLRPGTLVSVSVSLATYVMADVQRVVHQVQVEKLRILDRGDGTPALLRMPPVVAAYSSPSKRARDDSGDADFDAVPRYSEARFVPTKKARAGRRG
ncbi:hypothetical protein C8F01DRAFT_1365605 [Mycena amicta]|nr:hypothetical protein C8F01DRAFT_1365605 [Mycena amicta]